MKFTKSSGFTLIEALTCIAVIGILASFAIPSFSYMLGNMQLSEASHRLYHQLQYARKTAIDKNRPVTLCASVDRKICSKGRYWGDKHILTFLDIDGSGSIDNEDSLLSIMPAIKNNGSLSWRSFGNKSYIQWYPSGSTRFQNGNFIFCHESGDPKLARIIILNAAGRVYFGPDLNKDGIAEGANGKNVSC